MNDMAIEYNTELYKVNKILARMQSVGLNTEKFKNLLQEIEDGLAKSKEENVKKYFSEDMNLELINVAYQKAINKLNTLLEDMQKYEIYLKTAGFCGSLRAFLANENKDDNELDEMREKLLKLLDGIKKSGTLDYQIEGPLVEDIYNLTYEFIKTEIIELGASATLKVVQANEIDKNNVERAIINELEHLDLKDKKYRELVNKKYELESLGFRATYVDEEFISLIISSTTSYELNQKKLQELSKKLKEYYTRITDIDNTITTKTDKYNSTKEQGNSKAEFMGIVKNIIMTLTSLGVAVSLGFGALVLAKKDGTTTKNKVTTISSTLEETITEEEYCKPNEVKVGRFLYEYTPYKKFRNIFKEERIERTVTTYDLTNLEDLTLEEYLKLNFEQLGINGETETEEKEELTLKDLYEETYWMLKEVSMSEDDIISEFNLDSAVEPAILYLIIALILDACIEAAVIEKLIFRESNDYWGFIDGIKNIKSHYKDLKESKKDLKSKQQDLKELSEQAYKLITENQDIVNQIGQYLKYTDNETEKSAINKKLERVRALNSKYTSK